MVLARERKETRKVALPTGAEAERESFQNAVLFYLKGIYEMTKADIGASPQFKVFEFDLATGVQITKVSEQFKPDRWVVWTRTPTATTDTLRIQQGGFVSEEGAVEFYGGKLAIIPGTQKELSLHNSSPNSLHIWVVAVSQGDFVIAV